ncbi:hypothetical protein [Alicyclobacillus sp. SO9]|uniref:hypothetical protein n=1 Tax=Alicyclobacillus sp. SO9 TaxID=2665646 RepID=UPI0018E8B6D7|nr:hypothetical protein [Alicyclobacillus sp. SO9]QQE79560.1 hypothetical protein GI364_03425 [Alicyclobacillus sp. SO9]QQE79721.1 hypothetical protein GI364_04325 [Alicyclobacillus sp. SO9]
MRNRIRKWVLKSVNDEVYSGEAVDTVWFIVGGILVVALAYVVWPIIQNYASQFLTLLWTKITGLLS